MKFLIFILSALTVGAAVNTTTPGPMITLSTFECISVRAWYTNDANANNSVTLLYKLTSGSTWLNAYQPIIDRRSEIIVVGTTNSNTTNQFQARGSIVGLIPNTSYDVALTWSDADGIVGTASITNTVSTLSYNVPLTGNTKYVDASAGSEGNGSIGSPWKTITNAIIQSQQSDIIMVSPGRYQPFLITSNGNSAGYYALITNGAGPVSIIGGVSNNTIYISGSYWLIDGFNIEQSLLGGIHFGGSAHHVFVQNTLQTNAVSGTSSSAACEIYGICSNIYILSNTWSCWNPTITNGTAGLVDNVDFGEGPSVSMVVAYNTLNGGWDAIGNRGNSQVIGNCENTDLCHNTIVDNVDDTFEVDGFGPNIRVFDNHLSKAIQGFGGYGGSLFSDAGTYIGPMYVFRNFLHGYGTNAAGANSVIGLKTAGHSSVGAGFYFHNTFVTTASGGGHEVISEAGSGTGNTATTNKWFENNIWIAAGNVYWVGGTNNVHDYNLGFTMNGANFAGNWNGATNYTTFSDFQTGTGSESHGIGSDPLINYTTLVIPTNSPAVNAGLVISNFNDLSSAWPYSGSAPDMGAYETGGGGSGGSTSGLIQNTSRANVGRIRRLP